MRTERVVEAFVRAGMSAALDGPGGPAKRRRDIGRAIVAPALDANVIERTGELLQGSRRAGRGVWLHGREWWTARAVQDAGEERVGMRRANATTCTTLRFGVRSRRRLVRLASRSVLVATRSATRSRRTSSKPALTFARCRTAWPRRREHDDGVCMCSIMAGWVCGVRWTVGDVPRRVARAGRWLAKVAVGCGRFAATRPEHSDFRSVPQLPAYGCKVSQPYARATLCSARYLSMRRE